VLSASLFDTDSLRIIDSGEAAGSLRKEPAAEDELRMHFVFEELYGLDEAAFSSGHDHIYGIEVFPAIEASCQVGFGIDSGMEIFAQRASEA
jgi:hypothetical protein